MSMKSTTMMPPMSRSRSWRTISSAAFEVVLRHGLLEVSARASELARVDVDDRHRLRSIDHSEPAEGGRPSRSRLLNLLVTRNSSNGSAPPS